MTRPSSLRRARLAVALVWPPTLLVGTASAQTSANLTIDLNPSASITHTLPDGTSFTRAATLNPAGINFEDCERDIVLDFPLVATGTDSAASGYALYAFAGTGCDQGGVAVSPGVAGSTCWPVVDGPVAYDLDASGFTVALRARQILAQYALAVKQTYSSVASTDDSVCHLQPTSAALQVSVYFVFGTSEALTQVGGSGVAQIGVDLAASAPPTLLSVSAANEALVSRWSALTDEDTVGYNVYYAPAGDAGDAGAAVGGDSCPSAFPPGSTGSADAGVIITGGGSGPGSVAALSMQPREAVAGQYPFVAVAGNTATSGTVGGLTNGEDYVVGVAATDAYGNVGALSAGADGDMICQTPLATAGDAGSAGSADSSDSAEVGDGGCAVGGTTSPTGVLGSVFGAVAALILARRRRRAGTWRRERLSPSSPRLG